MQSTLKFGNQILHNPTKKVITSVLRKTPAYYEMSLYLMKSRINPQIISHLYFHGCYDTSSGAVLILHKNMPYLTIGSMISSLRAISDVENRFENGRMEVLMQYPTYPENIRTNEEITRMLGKAWKKT